MTLNVKYNNFFNKITLWKNNSKFIEK